MGKTSRNKGKEGEREVARILREKGYDATAQCAKDFFVAYRLADFFCFDFDEVFHRPVSGTSARLEYEVLQKLIPVFGMLHFRVELNGIQIGRFIAHTGNRAVCSAC